MRALITGASGLIGSRFIELYGKYFEKIYQLGRNQPDISTNWIELDFYSFDELTLPVVDVVFHFSGQTSAYCARDDVLYDLQVNLVGFVKMLEVLKQQQDRRPFVVYAGTATEVGLTTSSSPIAEDACNKPATFYDISKFSAESYLLQYVREGWLDGCSLRLCNVYGGIKNGQNSDRGVIDKIFQMALEKQVINIYGDGSYLRDYIHIDDVVSAFYCALQSRNTVNGSYYNIGFGEGFSIQEAFFRVVKLASEITGVLSDIVFVSPPDGLYPIEFRNFVADNRKFKNASGWNPRYTLESGIRYSYGDHWS